MAFGDNLKLLMKAHRITGEQLGQMFGKKKSAISFWVNNHSEPSIPELIAIKNMFNVTFEQLLEEDLANSYSFKKSNYIASEPTPQYSSRKDVVVIEKPCGATGGVCLFEQLRAANERIAELEGELKKKKL